MQLKQAPAQTQNTQEKKYLSFVHAGIGVMGATKAGCTRWCCWGVTASFWENFRTCHSISTRYRQGIQIQPHLQVPITQGLADSMAVLTISLLLSVVGQFLQNFCSAPLKKIKLHLVQHMEVLQEAKTQQMYNAMCSQTGYKNNPDLQSTLGSGTLSRQHFKVDLTNWKDRYSIFPPQTLCINRVMVTWPKVQKKDIELQSLRFEQGRRTGVYSFLLGLQALTELWSHDQRFTKCISELQSIKFELVIGAPNSKWEKWYLLSCWDQESWHLHCLALLKNTQPNTRQSSNPMLQVAVLSSLMKNSPSDFWKVYELQNFLLL